MDNFFAYWLYQAIELSRYPIPTEYRDGGVIDDGNKIYRNKSPYSFTEGPPFMFVYGALFSILMGAFSVFLGLTGLPTTKIFLIACVLGSASIIAFEIFHMTRSRFYAGLGFGCMLLTSPRFEDGFEYGLGAENGISSYKFHARGPVDIEGFNSLKNVVFGRGKCRVDVYGVSYL